MPPRPRQGRDNPGDLDENEDEAQPPFFNTTFSTHRVSPLYIGRQELTLARLAQLAHRLRDTLVGDVVRGIQIGLESSDTPSGQVGSLRSVKIRWFQAQNLLGGELTYTEQSGGGGIADSVMRQWNRLREGHKRGLWIEIAHENASYMALLLPGHPGAVRDRTASVGWAMQPDAQPLGRGADQNQFVHLPLLLLRMPQALKGVVGDWISTTFDCRVSKLNLGTRTLVTVWEDWIRIAGLPGKGPDFAISLAFNAPLPEKERSRTSESEEESDDDDDDDDDDGGGMSTEPGLRSMEITISPQDLRRFFRAGEQSGEPFSSSSSGPWENDARERRRLAGGNVDDGWAWRANQGPNEQPFTEALARYLDHHLALDLFHPSVRVVQISCGGFVLAQSRLKIVKVGSVSEELARAAWVFVTRLGERLRGEKLADIGF
ncbi:uncharacterized protein UV8b_00243 [Ustilaginoidea virens]|uniref:Siroheme synthase n=1 Tax=Ustilaginoidea virens TaxID=1159556 RepID=A0A063BYB6_USTVR|nr:uncharacterized protein UV8b_00243 [Ustilaginoidea virens]QUC16002.1 hypothetical protein UV8b_00243 [Ustilaginoidea virens]GAO16398.1 hypothetical protein UVI_02049500 [Ustilaginoidea virens]